MLNKKELLIIAHLRENARETLTNISKSTKIPISTIYDKLKTQYAGLIRKHVSLIDFNMLGYSIKAHIMLGVPKPERELIGEYLSKQFEVNSIYKINNGFDYLVEAIFKNIKEADEFVERVEEKFQVQNKHMHYVIEDIKTEAFMSDPKLTDIFSA